MLVEGNRVMVMYRFEAKATDVKRPNLSFRNAECLTFEKGRLSHVDVFFGDPPTGMTRAQFALSAGAG